MILPSALSYLRNNNGIIPVWCRRVPTLVRVGGGPIKQLTLVALIKYYYPEQLGIFQG